MSDNVETLNRPRSGTSHLQELLTSAAARSEPPEAEEEACAAFGYFRGIRDRALMLEFRLRNGNSQAFPYSWLGPVRYNPSCGLLLKFVGDLKHLVLIEGSNLNALGRGTINLYDRGIQRQRITWVREMSRHELETASAGELTIERIRLLAYQAEEELKQLAWLTAAFPLNTVAEGT